MIEAVFALTMDHARVTFSEDIFYSRCNGAAREATED